MSMAEWLRVCNRVEHAKANDDRAYLGPQAQLRASKFAKSGGCDDHSERDIGL
jgi:hypothetical protein